MPGSRRLPAPAGPGLRAVAGLQLLARVLAGLRALAAQADTGPVTLATISVPARENPDRPEGWPAADRRPPGQPGMAGEVERLQTSPLHAGCRKVPG
jgi:hypothetical protein